MHAVTVAGLGFALTFTVLARVEPADTVAVHSAREATGPSAASAAATGTPPTIAADALDEATVMRYLFSNYDAERKWSRRRDSEIRAKLTLLETFGAESARRYVACVASYRLRGGKVDDCHGCAAETAVFVFARDKRGWCLATHNPAADEGASNGNPSSARLVRIGPKRYGILFEGGGTFQGQSVGSSSLIDLGSRRLGRILEHLRTADSGYAAQDAGNAVEYARTVRLRFVPGANPVFYDIVAHETGTGPMREGSRKIVKIDRTSRYVHSRGRYVLAGGAEASGRPPSQASLALALAEKPAPAWAFGELAAPRPPEAILARAAALENTQGRHREQSFVFDDFDQDGVRDVFVVTSEDCALVGCPGDLFLCQGNAMACAAGKYCYAGSGFEAIVGDISKRLKCEAAYRDLDRDVD